MVKRAFLLLLGLLVTAGFSTETLTAQSVTRTIVQGGVVNGKAVSLPKPEYPQALKEAGIEATVAVNVTIDESGNVVAAEAELNDQRVRRAEDGSVLDPAVVDPGLRAAAEQAALNAKFAPTLVNGSSIHVKGKIVYNFVARPAAPTESTNGKLINGGVLNGKARSIPAPAYPAAAKAVAAQGAVNVQIVIDEEGNVVSATAISGHPLLRAAAEEAARLAHFSPTKLNGEPVRVTGVVTYNFVI